MNAGYQVTRGRQDEFGTIEAATLSLTLNNNDGRFTLGRAAPVYPLKVGMPIRVSTFPVGGIFYVPRFTGYVNTWPVEWPGGKTVSKAAISASDRFARLARRSLSGTVLRNEITTRSPAAYFPLNEPVGSTAATSTDGSYTLQQAGTGTNVVFGATTAPGSEISTAATFAGGKYLQAKNGPEYAPLSNQLGIVLAFSTASATNMGLFGSFTAGPLNVDLTMNAGVLSLNGNAVAGTWNDGLPHVVGIRYTGSNSSDVYVDGVLRTSFFVGTPSVLVDYRIGSDSSPLAGFTGTISDVAIWSTAPAAADFVSLTGALQGFAGERSDERITRLATYAGLAPADLALETGEQIMGAQTEIDGLSVVDAMRDVETAEQGLLFVDATGVLVFQNRSHRYNLAASITTTAAQIDPAARFSADDQGLYNRATITRPDGLPQTYSDAVSIADLEVYPYDGSVSVRTDDEALQIAAWIVNAHSRPASRLSSARFDLLTNPVSLATPLLAATARVSDVVTITALPGQAPAASVSLFIEGMSETCSNSDWSIDVNTSPTTAYNVWTIEDPVYGAYDSNPLAL